MYEIRQTHFIEAETDFPVYTPLADVNDKVKAACIDIIV